MRVLITGASGMLGRDAQLAARAAGHQAVPLSHAELDILDGHAVEGAIRHHQPDVVINCAAWTDVDGAESTPSEAFAANATGAQNVARASKTAGAWVIHISTDYVFDGEKGSPYVEPDLPNPLSVYGESKLAGEQGVAAAAPEAHTIVRSSWLFGSGGPSFPEKMRELAGERDELTVVDDQVGCPTFTGHLARALISLLEREPPTGVLHIAGAGECSWFQFACEVIAAVGADCEVKPGRTEELARPARRPAYSVMRSVRGAPELPDWREGLREFLGLEVGSR